MPPGCHRPGWNQPWAGCACQAQTMHRGTAQYWCVFVLLLRPGSPACSHVAHQTCGIHLRFLPSTLSGCCAASAMSTVDLLSTQPLVHWSSNRRVAAMAHPSCIELYAAVYAVRNYAACSLTMCSTVLTFTHELRVGLVKMGSRLVLMAYTMPDTFCTALYTMLKLPWPSALDDAAYSDLWCGVAEREGRRQYARFASPSHHERHIDI